MKIYISASSNKLYGIDRAFEIAYLDGKYTKETAKEYSTQFNGGMFNQQVYDSALKAIRYVEQNNIEYPDLFYGKELFCHASDYAYDQYNNSGREARKEYVKQFKKFVNQVNKKFISELYRIGIDGVSDETYIVSNDAPKPDRYSYLFLCTDNVPPLTDEQMSAVDSLVDNMLPEINAKYSELFGGDGDYLEVSSDLAPKKYRN